MLHVADYYSGTDTGRQRRHNEDSHFARAPLFVVADGMGGAQAGEVASGTAVAFFQGGLDHQTGSPEEQLAARTKQANTRIHELSRANADQAGMGTTLTAAYVGPEDVSIAHVGDSRAYCLRNGELIRLTDDHSLVDELLRQGRLTPEEAEDHPQRSIITRALGPEAMVDVDIRTHHARVGDVYLLCSDGLTTMVSEAQLGEILRANASLRAAGESLLAAANEAGGRDNITVVLFRVEDAEGVAHGDQPTMVGESAPSTAERNQALAAEQPSGPTASVGPEQATPSPAGGERRLAPRHPRRPLSAPAARPRRRRARGLVGSAIALGVIALILAGAYIASQAVYFVGTNNRGFVTLFRGVPYELPGHLRLYTTNFVSGVSASTLGEQRRRTLLDHSLRSHDDAIDLMRRLELGQISAG